MHNHYMVRTFLAFAFAWSLLMGTFAVLRANPGQSTQESLRNENTAPLSEGVSVMRADDSGISFILNTTNLGYSGEGKITSFGLNASTQEPGAPELPYFSTYIAVPPEAVVSIDVLQQEMIKVPGVNVQAAAEPTLSFVNSDPDSPFPVTAVSPKPAARTPNLAIYGNDTLYPNTLFKLSEPVYFRDMRLVKLDLYPIQYKPLQQELQQTQQMQVNIHFEGAKLDNLRPAPSPNDAYQNTVSDMVLNFEQGKAWRSLPLAEQDSGEGNLAETAVSLPLGAKTYKIEIDQDGIYDISGADLISAGMNIASVNPANIEMMSRGEAVAYTFIKNGANPAVLQRNDIIRFYGEGVNGSRREKQFLTHNVYWLWANGNRTPITTTANAPGAETVTSFTDSITREDENYFFSTWTNQWDKFPNEADSWYWDLITSPATKTYTIDLPDPVGANGQTATYTVEFLARENYSFMFEYPVDICLNSPSECLQKTWKGKEYQNINITKTVPITTLVDGTNNFTIHLAKSTNPVGTGSVYLNRITVDYLRALKAQNDQLFFSDGVGGRAMVVQDFGENNPNNILVWDISTPTSPIQIVLDSGDIIEENGRYTYTIGINSSTAQNYIATTTANTLSPDKISSYTPPTNLEPANGADWVAISYSDFITQANILATHRAQPDFGRLKTHVVDIKDIINVYGYGLPMPEAIHTYLTKSLTWSTKPSYVLLFGDGLIAPRHLNCLAYCTIWDITAQNLVPTDLSFTDRYQGLVPTDNTAIFLVGDDLLADMAIGRLSAETTAQATAMVEKIIQYEENLHAQTPASKRVLFLADFPDPDAGGNFCNTNQNLTGPLLPSEYEQIHLCRENYPLPPPSSKTFTETITEKLAEGVSLINYRGHGAIQSWGDNPSFWNADASVTDEQLKWAWANEGNPPIILSADCLDGHFAWPGRTALSERFMRLDQKAGSAAHWSSAGLGLDYEHTALLEGFYEGMFDQGHTNLGDAVNYAKLFFSLSASYSKSEMYSFNLQGDPAMQAKLPPPKYYVFLPMIKK